MDKKDKEKICREAIKLKVNDMVKEGKQKLE